MSLFRTKQQLSHDILKEKKITSSNNAMEKGPGKRDHKQGILIKKIVIVTCYLRLAVFFLAFVGSADSRQYHLSLSYL